MTIPLVSAATMIVHLVPLMTRRHWLEERATMLTRDQAIAVFKKERLLMIACRLRGVHASTLRVPGLRMALDSIETRAELVRSLTIARHQLTDLARC